MEKHRVFRAFVAFLGLLTSLMLPLAGAEAAPTLPVIRPAIIGATITAVCNLDPCRLTVNLTYNAPVGFTSGAAAAFQAAWAAFSWG